MLAVIAGIAIALIIISVLFYIIQKIVLNKVSMYTYTDPERCEKELSGTAAKIFIPKRERLIMMIEPYILQNNDAALNEVVSELNQLKLSDYNRIGINQKLLEYYALHGQGRKAESIYDESKIILAKEPFKSDEKYQSILLEAEQMIEIYARRNGAYLTNEKKLAEAADHGPIKGIYYYRCAKLAYYNDDKKQMKNYLESAKTECRGSQLEKNIDRILSGEIQCIENM